MISPIWKEVGKTEHSHHSKNASTEKNLINSLNRSIVFNNDKVGPDIHWLVPPGLAWNNKYFLILLSEGIVEGIKKFFRMDWW